MAKRRTRRTPAERELEKQIARTEEILELALKQERAADAAKAQTLVVRLSADLQQRRAARLAGAERDPIRRLELMRELAEQAGSWVAAQRYEARVADARRAAEEAASSEDERELSVEELAVELRADMRDWPDQYLELAVEEMARRHQGRWRLLRVIEGQEPEEVCGVG